VSDARRNPPSGRRWRTSKGGLRCANLPYRAGAGTSPIPFGANAPNANPQGLGSFAYNLRLPGQYFNAESGLHYNTHRDYDPRLGRYLESDPMGLAGGVNTYACVDSNPLNWVDPFGLTQEDVKLLRKINFIGAADF
jgi:RHS repeat-associated protein